MLSFKDRNILKKEMNKVYILLGTNLGEKITNLKTACDKISSTCGKIVQRSSLYETTPWGNSDQPVFVNGVIELETLLSSEVLLHQLLEIEKQMGRIRIQKWGERLIDLDILYYNDFIASSETLKIPHPELQNRNFTLVPLCEIAPDFIHPIFQRTTQELLKDCTDKETVIKISTTL
jgi:2-amino-4-hydroxy-6-hydroxymethyldihydropteridine diphosphokinase